MDVVGGFLEASLHFGDASSPDTLAGAVASLTLIFRYAGTIQAGASVVLILPSFGILFVWESLVLLYTLIFSGHVISDLSAFCRRRERGSFAIRLTNWQWVL
jgi:hypothetical protein